MNINKITKCIVGFRPLYFAIYWTSPPRRVLLELLNSNAEILLYVCSADKISCYHGFMDIIFIPYCICKLFDQNLSVSFAKRNITSY